MSTLETTIGGEDRTESQTINLLEFTNKDSAGFIRLRWQLQLQGVDLTGYDFSGLDLSNADFRDALLIGADFSKAQLSGADFSQSDLTNTEFGEANLAGTKFFGARISGANLAAGDLTFAYLSGITEPIPLSSLRAAPKTEISDALPRLPFLADETDYSEHPSLGDGISHNTLLVALHPGTTVEQVNQLLNDCSGEIMSAVPGVADQTSAIIIIRLGTTTHSDLEIEVHNLESRPEVSTVAVDFTLEASRISNPFQPDWHWSLHPFGGNWGLESMKIPQLWNFNDSLQKDLDNGTLELPVIGMIDTWHDPDHPDLSYLSRVEETRSRIGTVESLNHGTHVLGIMLAEYSNLSSNTQKDIGIDGIFPSMLNPRVVSTGPNWWNVISGTTGNSESVVADLCNQIAEHCEQGVDVVSVTSGCGWGESRGIDANKNHDAQDKIRRAAAVLREILNTKCQENHSLPLIVSSAGNDSGPGGFPDTDARWNSPLNYLALSSNPISDILVVESCDQDLGLDLPLYRSDFSNVGGHVTAPGRQVLSCDSNGGYSTWDGTSFSTPHIAAIAAYLRALDPSLTNANLRDIILNPNNSRPVTSSTTHKDTNGMLVGWFAALDIDRIRSNDRILRKMLDIDDGTTDGNLRVANGQVYTDESAGNGVGDGKIDMSDFRRWRDWFLICNEPKDNLHFNGGPDHPKSDVNDDGDWEADEIFPRGDFNGDGKLSIGAGDISKVPLRLQHGGTANRTDLQVLAKLFSDEKAPFWDPARGAADEQKMNDYAYSADIHFDASSFLDDPMVNSIRIAAFSGDGTTETPIQSQVETSLSLGLPESPASGAKQVILTVPISETDRGPDPAAVFKIKITGHGSNDGSGEALLSLEETVIAGLGQDIELCPCRGGSLEGFMEFVVVGNAENAPDPGNTDEPSIHGSVPEEYRIGKYEVTNAQYVDFLNSVASIEDEHGLFNSSMSFGVQGGIIRTAVADGFRYDAKVNMDNKPVAWVSWYDCLRFCNWLHNGRPMGNQDSSTTECGAYTLDDTSTVATGTHPTYGASGRNLGACYFLPSFDEWYKAAYHEPGGSDDDYWFFPTRSDTHPSNVVGGSPNSANFRDDGVFSVTQDKEYSVDQIFLTDVGEFSGSRSYYGAFDMGGNLAEWIEQKSSDNCGWRGGSWLSNRAIVGREEEPREQLRSTYPDTFWSGTKENETVGFRVAGR